MHSAAEVDAAPTCARSAPVRSPAPGRQGSLSCPVRVTGHPRGARSARGVRGCPCGCARATWGEHRPPRRRAVVRARAGRRGFRKIPRPTCAREASQTSSRARELPRPPDPHAGARRLPKSANPHAGEGAQRRNSSKAPRARRACSGQSLRALDAARSGTKRHRVRARARPADTFGHGAAREGGDRWRWTSLDSPTRAGAN